MKKGFKRIPHDYFQILFVLIPNVRQQFDAGATELFAEAIEVFYK